MVELSLSYHPLLSQERRITKVPVITIVRPCLTIVACDWKTRLQAYLLCGWRPQQPTWHLACVPVHMTSWHDTRKYGQITFVIWLELCNVFPSSGLIRNRHVIPYEGFYLGEKVITHSLTLCSFPPSGTVVASTASTPAERGCTGKVCLSKWENWRFIGTFSAHFPVASRLLSRSLMRVLCVTCASCSFSLLMSYLRKTEGLVSTVTKGEAGQQP